MKVIRVGEKNDLHLFAAEDGGRFYPLTKIDLDHERPSAKIYYDEGIYPSITNVPDYICAKASDMVARGEA